MVVTKRPVDFNEMWLFMPWVWGKPLKSERSFHFMLKEARVWSVPYALWF